MPARLIAIEGIDQSGKHTQTRLLAKALRKKKRKVDTISFPIYNSISGKELKQFLDGQKKIPAQAVHMLYSLNRWENKDKIRDKLKESDYLIADRYTTSNIAYGTAKGLDQKWLENLDKGLPKPAMVIVLDVPVSSSFNRKTEKRDLHEKNRQFLAKVRLSYHKLARQYKWKIVEANMSADQVHSQIWKQVQSRFRIK
jgi:dTMP kinase